MNKSKKLLLISYALATIISFGGCSSSGDTSSPSGSTDSAGENSPDTSSMLADGEYVFKSRVIKGSEQCKDGENCLTLEQYQMLCERVTGITAGMSKVLEAFPGSPAFGQLISGGNIDAVTPEWSSADVFTKESGIIGSCDVTVTVSGLYEGSSSREQDVIFAYYFIVTGDDVLVHEGYRPAMGLSRYML